MRYSKSHSFIIVNSDRGNIRIGGNIVIIKNSRGVACFKILHPGIVQRKTQDKGASIIILEHKNIIGSFFLKFCCYRNHICYISCRFCHLPEADHKIISELMRFFIFHIFDQDAETFCIIFLPPQSGLSHFYCSIKHCFS